MKLLIVSCIWSISMIIYAIYQDIKVTKEHKEFLSTWRAQVSDATAIMQCQKALSKYKEATK